MTLDGKKHVEVVKSMFMVYKFFYCVFGEYIRVESKIILFFCINFACHETMKKRKGTSFLSQMTVIIMMNQSKVTNFHQHSSVYDECDGPKKRTTICLKDGYTFLVTTKFVYILYI